MKRLLLVTLLIAPGVQAVDLKDTAKKLCQDHPIKLQCEELVSSMLTHSYVMGQTQLGCELGIIDACKAARTNKHFEKNARWLEQCISTLDHRGTFGG